MFNRELCKAGYLRMLVRSRYPANQAYQILRTKGLSYRRKDFLADYNEAINEVNQEKMKKSTGEGVRKNE